MVNPYKYFKNSYHNLNELVDQISSLLECPITLEDPSFNLLAYSSHSGHIDEARVFTIIGRRVPEKVTEGLWRYGVIPALLNSADPVRVNRIDEINLGERVAIAIRHQQEVIGFIWALGVKEPFSEEKMEILKEATLVIKNILLKKNGKKTAIDKEIREVFWELLNDYVISYDQIEEILKQYNIQLPQMLSVIVLSNVGLISKEKMIQISYILQTASGSNVVYYTHNQQEIVIIASPDSQTHPDESIRMFIAEVLQKLGQQLKQEHIQAGCGLIYDHYKLLSKSYQEALQVIKIKKKLHDETQNIYLYHDLGAFQFLEYLSEQNKKSEILNQRISKLLHYDQKNNSELVKTLDVFLSNDNNIIDTAEALHIHVNTLNYRLKRLAEIGDINLKDAHQKFSLYLALKLLKYDKHDSLKAL